MLPRDRGERNPQAGLVAIGVVLAINGILFIAEHKKRMEESTKVTENKQ